MLRLVLRASPGAYEGHIAQYLGDGLLVYFGYPRAHEDDAPRAVRAGLGIVEALGPLNARLTPEQGVHLAVRLGIHTGLVVVGDVGSGPRQEQLALGETPNVAARLQGMAAPNTLLISAATWQLLSGFFVCQPFGTPRVKGLDQPLAVYQVLAETTARSRLEAVGSTGLTPLVGRAQEIALLRERWAQVKDGRGQVVLLSGEAGIGKSRLVQAFTAQLTGEAFTQIVYHCSPYAQQSAFYPVVEHLQRRLQFRIDDTPAEQLHKLEAALGSYDFALEEAVPLVAALLGLPRPERYPPLMLTPERQKQQTLETLLTWLLHEAEQQSVCVVMEDLHWGDPSTLEWLSLLVAQVPTARVLLLLLFRPEFQPPWTMRSYLTPLALSRLSNRQTEAMLGQVAGDTPLPAEVVQQVVATTDGVPLFVEELTKMVLESDGLQEHKARDARPGALPALAIPATLHDALMARLDRLSPGKVVAQLGATIGRTFAAALLQAVTPLAEAAVQDGLRQLVEAGLVYPRGVGAEATYGFKHALIQEAAYQSLLRSTRQQYHQRIAQVLEAQFPATVETQPELLAQHYTAAGLPAQAIPYWQRAGHRALERSAYPEALAHVTQGLALLDTGPDAPERTQQALTLHLSRARVLLATQGYAAPDVHDAFTRAQGLCHQAEDTPERFEALQGLLVFATNRGALPTAQQLGEQLLRLAERLHDPPCLLQAHFGLGAALFYRGELTRAAEHLEYGLALSPPQPPRAAALGHTILVHGTNLMLRSHAAWVLWLRGYPDQARHKSHEALRLAQEMAHPYYLAVALNQSARLHQFCRDAPRTQEHAEAAIALCTAQGFAFHLAMGAILRGWALAAQGPATEDLVQLQQGLAAWRTTGAELSVPQWLALLAEAYWHGGHAGHGGDVLAEAVQIARTHGEAFYAAELHRLTGECVLQSADRAGTAGGQGREAEAEDCFRQALALAHQQQAKSLELRAAMSLARLWQQQGKHGEAYDLLAPIYHWFTEGFDTADLQDANALLEKLGG